MNTRSDRVTVRLTAAELSLLQTVAKARGETKVECLRAAARFGLPFIQAGTKLDIYRLIANIEYLQAALETIITRDHPEVADRLLDIAVERVEQYHA